MALIYTMPTFVNWSFFVAVFLGGLGMDLRHMRQFPNHMPTPKEAALEMVKWLGLAVLMGIYILLFVSVDGAVKYANGYVIEFSLSADNLGVILMTFLAFALPAKHWQKVLWYGILGMIIMRGLFIGFGITLVEKFELAIPFFGLILIRAGLNMLKHDESKEIKRDELMVVRFMQRFLGRAFVKAHLKDGRFFARVAIGGVAGYAMTMTFANLLVVEGFDLVFAVDSIPAVLGITTDPFLVATSNLMAVLGLRSLFFLIAGTIKDLVLLPFALCAILVFVGGKMIVAGLQPVKEAMEAVSHWFWETDFSQWHVDPFVSLGIIIGILVVCIGLSVAIDRWKKRRLANGHGGPKTFDLAANLIDSEIDDDRPLSHGVATHA